MKYLRKLPGHRQYPSGIEWTVLKKLPIILAGGTAIPVFVSVGTRWFPPQGTISEVAKHIAAIDILAIAAVLMLWMTALGVAIVCFVVVLMKGPAYVADAYPLVDRDQPNARASRRRR